MGGYLLIPSLSHWLSSDRSGKREKEQEADWPESHDVEDKFPNTTQVMDEGAHKNNTTFSTVYVREEFPHVHRLSASGDLHTEGGSVKNADYTAA